jgi:hypothetical protein
VQRRRETEDDGGCETDEGKERKHRPVHPEFHVVRLADILGDRVEEPDTHDRQGESDGTAEKRQQHALDEQLTDEASP